MTKPNFKTSNDEHFFKKKSESTYDMKIIFFSWTEID